MSHIESSPNVIASIKANKLFRDKTGIKNGNITVLRLYGKGDALFWLCQCFCGKQTVVRSQNIPKTHSCGCTRRGNTRHGMSGTKEYKIWRTMNQRCNNPNCHKWPSYGGRGIKICAKWKKFENFLEDMGPKPSPIHSIERIDNDGNYSPLNCRWATPYEQSRNTRNNVMLDLNGIVMCVEDWAKRIGIDSSSLRGRLKSGWPLSKALTIPKQHRAFDAIPGMR